MTIFAKRLNLRTPDAPYLHAFLCLHSKFNPRSDNRSHRCCQREFGQRQASLWPNGKSPRFPHKGNRGINTKASEVILKQEALKFSLNAPDLG
jgi:hypothetical protein